LIVAMTMPASTNTTIAACSQIHTGDTRRSVLPPAALAVLLVACALLATACGGASPDRDRGPALPPGLRVGVIANTLDWGGRQVEQQRRARDAGAGWLREEVRWNEVEPRRGDRRWQRTDEVVANAARNGLRVLPLLYGTPRWAGPAKSTIPRSANRFGAFTGRAVARYGPGGAFWRAHPDLDPRLAPVWFEIWNEPYYPQFANSAVDPGRYARLVRTAALAGRRANPRARFLMAGEIGYADPGGVGRPWLRALFAAVPDLGRYFDALAVHPYTEEAPGATPPTTRTGFRRINALRDQVRTFTGQRKPLWITEIGWSTCTLRPRCVTEAEQATRVNDLFRLVGAGGRRSVDAVFLYHLNDLGGSERDPQQRFGLVATDGRRKPSWQALRRITGGPGGR